MLALFSSLAGRELEIDEAVFRSELATGHRNRAIAYMMLNSGMIKRDPNEVLDLYFRQCSVNVTARDLAIMAATLANDGANPLTGAGRARDPICPRHAVGDEFLRHVRLCRRMGLRGRHAGQERRVGLHHRRDPRADRHLRLFPADRPARQQRARHPRLPGNLQGVRAARLQQPHQCAERDPARLSGRPGALEPPAHAGGAQDPGGEGPQGGRARGARRAVLRLDRAADAPPRAARDGCALRDRRLQARASRRRLGPQADRAGGARHGGRRDRARVRLDARRRAACRPRPRLRRARE